MKRNIYKLYFASLLAIAVVGLGITYSVVTSNPSALAQIGGGVGWFNIVQDVMISGDLQVNDDTAMMSDLSVAADLLVSDGLSVTGNSTLSGSVLVDDHLRITEKTRVVVTDGSTITPLGTFTPISATATTGTSSIAAGLIAGQLLILHNIGSATITLTDTGTLHLTGNGTLTADDSTILIWDGAAWNQLAAESAN
jgi:hypothetical protein